MRWIALLIGVLLGCNGEPQTEMDSASHEGSDTAPRDVLENMAVECAAPSGSLGFRFVSPNGELNAHLRVVEAGRRSLEVRTGPGDSVVFAFTAGIVDLYWLPDSEGLVYAVAPIYDAPGIFLREVAADTAVVLVKPQVVTRGYPDGADWIRLCGVERIGSETWIRFANFGHVDSVNFRDPPPPAIQRKRIPGID